MIRILLCEQLARIAGVSCLHCGPLDVPTVKRVLRSIFSQAPNLERHVLDSTEALDARTAVFVDSASLHDRLGLSDEIRENCTLHVMRSLGPPVSMSWSTDWRQHRNVALKSAVRNGEALAGQKLVFL